MDRKNRLPPGFKHRSVAQAILHEVANDIMAAHKNASDLTQDQLAELTGRCRRSIGCAQRYLDKVGILVQVQKPGRRIGALWTIDESTLEQIIKEGKSTHLEPKKGKSTHLNQKVGKSTHLKTGPKPNGKVSKFTHLNEVKVGKFDIQDGQKVTTPPGTTGDDPSRGTGDQDQPSASVESQKPIKDSRMSELHYPAFPTNESNPWILTDALVTHYQQEFPNLDIGFHAMKAWRHLMRYPTKWRSGQATADWLWNWLLRDVGFGATPHNGTRVPHNIPRWTCPHVDPCPNAAACRNATLIGRPTRLTVPLDE